MTRCKADVGSGMIYLCDARHIQECSVSGNIFKQDLEIKLKVNANASTYSCDYQKYKCSENFILLP